MWEQQSSKVSAFSFCFQPGSLTILDLDGCTEELHLKWGNGRHLFTRLQFLLRHHVEQVKTTLKFYLLPSNFSPQIIKLHINLYDNSWFKDSLEAFSPCAIQSVLISYLFYTYLLSGSVVSDPLDCSLPDSSLAWDFPGKNTGMGCHFLFQGILLTQGLSLCLLHCSGFFLSSVTGEAHFTRSSVMSIPVSQFIPSHHPPSPTWCPHVCSLCLCPYFCFANRLISTIFWDSIYMC